MKLIKSLLASCIAISLFSLSSIASADAWVRPDNQPAYHHHHRYQRCQWVWRHHHKVKECNWYYR